MNTTTINQFLEFGNGDNIENVNSDVLSRLRLKSDARTTAVNYLESNQDLINDLLENQFDSQRKSDYQNILLVM